MTKLKIVRKARIRRTSSLKRKSKIYLGVLNGRVCFRDSNILVFNNTSLDYIKLFATKFLIPYIKVGVKFRINIDE
jgi:hypothetical protein